MKTFYWYFRPIACCAKIFGVLPLQNLHCSSGSKIRFSYFSVAQLYSAAVFFSVLSSFLYFSGFPYPGLRTDGVLFWKVVVAYMILVRSVICYVFCVHHSKKLPALIHMLETFDQNKGKLLKIEDRVVKRFFVRCLFPFLNGLFYMTANFGELHFFIKSVLPTAVIETATGVNAALIFGILGDWQVYPLLLYTYFAFSIKVNFEDLSGVLRAYGPLKSVSEEQTTADANFAVVLEELRCLHNLMAAAVDQLAASFGSFMAVDQFFLNAMFVLNLYVYFFMHIDDLHLLLCTLLNAMLLLLVIMASHKVKESGIQILEPLRSIRSSKVDERSRLEIQLFLSQLASRPIEISAAGFFVMDRAHLPTILSAVATYFIALVQFGGELRSFTTDTNRTFT